VIVRAPPLRLVGVVLYLRKQDRSRIADHWRPGGEAGRIARSITQGEGFSNPLFGPSLGPTAMAVAVFPYLLAGISKNFASIAKLRQSRAGPGCLLSALTCIPVSSLRKNIWGECGSLGRMGLGIFSLRDFPFRADFIWATDVDPLLMTSGFSVGAAS